MYFGLLSSDICLSLFSFQRHICSSLNESTWITASIISILQILFLAGPVLVISWEDANVFFFVRASVITLMSMGVTLFILLPKMRFHFKTDGDYAMQSTVHISGLSSQLPARAATNSGDMPSRSMSLFPQREQASA